MDRPADYDENDIDLANKLQLIANEIHNTGTWDEIEVIFYRIELQRIITALRK
jgi:hypothetical protein